MNPKDVVELVVASATLLTALAAVWTIVEVKRQREASYRPTIVIPGDVISVFQKGGIIYIQDREESHFEHPYRFGLQNIGFGAAVNIKTTWKVDYDKVLLWLEQIDVDKIFEIENDHLVQVKSCDPKFANDFGSDKNPKIDRYDYLQPESSGDAKSYVEAPFLLFKLLETFLYLVWRSAQGDPIERRLLLEEKHTHWPAEIFFEYSDISGTAHSASYGLKLDLKISSGANSLGEHHQSDLHCALVLRRL